MKMILFMNSSHQGLTLKALLLMLKCTTRVSITTYHKYLIWSYKINESHRKLVGFVIEINMWIIRWFSSNVKKYITILFENKIKHIFQKLSSFRKYSTIISWKLDYENLQNIYFLIMIYIHQMTHAHVMLSFWLFLVFSKNIFQFLDCNMSLYDLWKNQEECKKIIFDDILSFVIYNKSLNFTGFDLIHEWVRVKMGKMPQNVMVISCCVTIIWL